jgi:hypothetical protein
MSTRYAFVALAIGFAFCVGPAAVRADSDSSAAAGKLKVTPAVLSQTGDQASVPVSQVQWRRSYRPYYSAYGGYRYPYRSYYYPRYSYSYGYSPYYGYSYYPRYGYSYYRPYYGGYYYPRYYTGYRGFSYYSPGFYGSYYW